MMRKIREALPPSALVSIAAGAGEYFLKGTEMDKVARYLDYVQLMTYDMCGGKTTMHHTNLFKPENSVRYSCADNAVSIFHEAGIPLDKLIIGAAFYSREWKAVTSSENGGFAQPSDDSVGFGPNYAELCANYINKNDYVRHWDDSAKAPYLFNGKHFLTYDDEESVAYKCRYIKDRGLKGIMYWEHSLDENRRLLEVINKCL